jgi:hypothetical protein
MLRWILPVLAASAGVLGAAPVASADQWFKTDTHVHSSAVSGDAPQDLGIISEVAHQQGLDALFLTDHTAAGTQPIGGVISNHPRFDDDITQWSQDSYSPASAPSTVAPTHAAAQPTAFGAPTLAGGNTLLCELGAPTTSAAGVALAASGNSTTNELVSLPANTGTQSLHLASTNSGFGETFASLKRGPNLHSGNITMKFSIDPARIDPGSGLYVSLSIGGDESIPNRPPTGYTPQGGSPTLGKHTILVWQLGNARQDSSDPNDRVITHQLPYMTGVWNNYTIDVTQALNEIPAADRPTDLDGLAMLKMSAAANGGSADGYFDSFSMDTAADMTQGQEFVYRNQRIHDYDTSSFKIYPSQEAGYNRHVQQFNFGITSPSQFTAWKQGTQSVASTQATGYPAQMDHPGLPGGASFDDAVSTQGGGTDGIETAERGEFGLTKNVMVDTWDAILKQGVQILGSWSSDAHRPEKFGESTVLLSPSIGFDDLMRSYYEGRSYNALTEFTGRAIYNIDGSATDPYPARYPVWVSPSQVLGRVHFKVTGGVSPGSHVIWTRNGDPVESDAVSGSSYDATRSFSLDGLWTYVRAELRDSTDQRVAMSQPIFFRDTSTAMPVGMNFHVAGVTTPTGNGYTKTMTKGITSSSWDDPNRTLTIGLTNPNGSLVELRSRTAAQVPLSVTVDGIAALAAASRADYDGATGSTWWFDSASHTLLVKARQDAGSGTGTVVVGFVPALDGTPPSQPTGLSAHATSSREIDVNWAASSGDVDGYTVYRDGIAVANTTPDVTSFSDSGLAGGTHYTYTVDAFDLAENHSAPSGSASATTDVLATSTINPVADAYVDASHATTRYGTSAALRIDSAPVVRTYLRFDVSGLQGTVERAQLRLFTNSNSNGHEAHSADNAWSETTITAANAPPPSDAIYGSGHVTPAGAWSTTDVTPMVSGNGTITIALDEEVGAAISYQSRESANPPQLVVDTTIPSNDPPSAGDTSLTTADDTQASWTPSVHDPDGDATTCSIVAQPAHGTASVASDCSAGTYLPAPGYSGPDSFTYKASDSHGADSNSATVSATVTSTNHAPTAGDRSISTAQGVAGAWTPSVSDADGDALSCEVVAQPAHGTASVASDCSAGSYSPAPGYSGDDSFTYRALDSHGAPSNTATVSATVAPSALFSDGFESGNVSAWTSSKGLAVQTAVVRTGSFAARGQSTNGASYAKKALGSTYSDVVYRVAFRSQTAPTGTATIMKLRTSNDKALAGLYMTSARKLSLRNDVTATGKSSTTALALGQWYTLELHVVVNGTSSTVEVRVDGNKVTDLSSTATDLGTVGVGMLQIGENSTGPTYDYVYDDVTASAGAVSNPNHAPTAADRSLTAPQDTAASWTPSVADIDADTLTCAVVAQPAHGSATVAADCSAGGYTPAAGYSGSDSFTYRATDSHSADSNTATVSATVTPANHAPTAGDRSLTTDQDVPGSWTPDVADPDVDPLTCAIVSQPAHGSASVAADCSAGGYTPAAGYGGSDSFTYRATDSHSADSNTATVSATVVVPSVFSDGFEAGNLSAWSSSKGLATQTAIVRNGSFAARGTTTNGVTYAKKALPSVYNDLTYRASFRYEGSAPATSATIMRLRTAADKALVGLYLTSGGRLGMRNEVTAASKTSTRTLTAGQWYALELHAIVNGATASTIEVRVDGTNLTDVSSTTANLGTTGTGMLQLGENAAGAAYDFVFDDVIALHGAVGQPASPRQAAASCTPRSSVRLRAARRQRVARRGIVNIAVSSAEPCRLKAFAVTRSRRGRKRFRSNAARVTVDGGRPRPVRLAFSRAAVHLIRRDLAHSAVGVVVSAVGRGRLARRTVVVKR